MDWWRAPTDSIRMGALDVPTVFTRIPYRGAAWPGSPLAATWRDGANCQVFAYALLAHFGRPLPPLRSSDLWADVAATVVVEPPFEPLDILLWHRTPDAWGAHVGVYVGDDRVLHLARWPGVPEVRLVSEFAADPRYRCFIGAKRVTPCATRP